MSLNIPAATKPVRIILEGTPLLKGMLVLTGCRWVGGGERKGCAFCPGGRRVVWVACDVLCSQIWCRVGVLLCGWRVGGQRGSGWVGEGQVGGLKGGIALQSV